MAASLIGDAARMHMRRILGLAIAIVATGACGLVQVTGGETTRDDLEDIPGLSTVDLSGDPERAPRDLVIDFIDDDGDVLEDQTSEIAAGEVIRARAIGVPDEIHVLVNGQPCLGSVDFVLESTTTAVLRLTDDGCEVATLRVEPGS